MISSSHSFQECLWSMHVVFYRICGKYGNLQAMKSIYWFCWKLAIQIVKKITKCHGIIHLVRTQKHFYPLIRTHTCMHQEVRNISFSENLRTHRMNGPHRYASLLLALNTFSKSIKFPVHLSIYFAFIHFRSVFRTLSKI